MHVPPQYSTNGLIHRASDRTSGNLRFALGARLSAHLQKHTLDYDKKKIMNEMTLLFGLFGTPGDFMGPGGSCLTGAGGASRAEISGVPSPIFCIKQQFYFT